MLSSGPAFIPRLKSWAFCWSPCNECNQEREDANLRYNEKWKNNICRLCFVSELMNNAQKNVAQKTILGLSPTAFGLAQQAANKMFDEFPPARAPQAEPPL